MKTYIVGAIKKAIVLTLGLPLLIVGLVLIPAPGPGLPVVALALFILSVEFEFASKYLQSIKQKMAYVYNRSINKYHQSLKDIDER